MSEMALELIARAKAEKWLQLDLGNCGIVGAVPEEIGELDELEELSFFEDPESDEYLSIDNKLQNSITLLSKSFPKNLQVLNISNTDIRCINLPSGLQSLKKLLASSTKIDPWLDHFIPPSLEVIDFSDSPIENIDFLNNCAGLTSLILSGTKVSDFSTLKCFSNLRELDLSNSWIQREISLEFNTKLEWISVASCRIDKIKNLDNCENLHHLDLSSTEISELPRLDRCRNLKNLNLSSTKVSHLGSIYGMRSLKNLFLNFSIIDDFTPIRSLPGLVSLDLRGTKIENLEIISQLHLLKSLNISNTEIKDLSEIASLKKLEVLSLLRTKAQDIAPLRFLLELRDLDLSQSKIENLEPLRHLEMLERLCLSHTRIQNLLPIRKLIEKGLPIIRHQERERRQTYIEIIETKISNPPLEILKNGRESILTHWNEQDRVGVLPAKELKLFLLGNTTAGKSTLAHALLNNEYLEESSSTEGANLSQTWQTDDIDVNIWDFGGQEYFHATHQLLMNDNALYIVLADPKFDESGYHKTWIRYSGETQSFEEEVEHFPHGYWLQMIKQHANRSGAMLVWNKLEEEDCPPFGLSDTDKALFEYNIKEYECSLKGAFLDNDSAWQNKWKVFVDDLQHRITEQLEDKQVIQYWPSVRELIKERSKTDIRISWNEFEKLCKVDDPLREMGNIAIYLRDMCGAILYFPDHPKLNKTVFINPNKINELIYAVLNRQVKNAGGRFTWDHAKERVRTALTAMDESEADAFAAELLAVMEEFKIVFEVSKDSGEYVAPQYLPRDEPASLEKEIRRAKLELAFQLRFKSFVPRHIIPRFIAEKGLFAKDETWWKFGILYEETTEATALVQVDYPSQIVSVSIHEPKKHQLELLEIFQLCKELIGNDQAFELSLDGKSWVDFGKLKEAIDTKASLVMAVDRSFLDVKPFSFFTSNRTAAHNSIYSNLPISTPMKHIYISYANEDGTDLDEIENKLKTLQKLGKFSSWSRRHIIPGGKTREVISNELSRADVVIMLVSSNYISIEGEGAFEHDLALNQGKEGKCLIVPIVLRSTFGWEGLPFGEYPPALEGRPIDLEPNKDQAWARIMEWIDKILEVQAEKNEGSVSNLGPDETHNSLIKIAKDVSAMSIVVGEVRESQIRIEGGIETLLELTKEQRDEIRKVQSFVEQNIFTEDQMVDAIQVIEELVAVHIDDLEADVKEEFAKLKSKDLEIKKRLKMTIPIIPFVLRYELDMTDNSKDKKGRSLWKDMKNGKILF